MKEGLYINEYNELIEIINTFEDTYVEYVVRGVDEYKVNTIVSYLFFTYAIDYENR